MKANEASLPWHELDKELAQLEVAMATADMVKIREMLKRLVGYVQTNEPSALTP